MMESVFTMLESVFLWLMSVPLETWITVVVAGIAFYVVCCLLSHVVKLMVYVGIVMVVIYFIQSLV